MTQTTTQARPKQTLYLIIIGLIIILAIFISSELIAIISKNNHTDHELNKTVTTINEQASASAAISATPVVTEELLANEITEIMAIFNVQNVNADPDNTIYDETDVEALSLANINQTAPPAGTYKAINLFEQGIEKNLHALEEQGRIITIVGDGAGHATVNFFGLTFAATYDNHYLYFEDGSRMPYYWSDGVITAAAHRIELDLVKID